MEPDLKEILRAVDVSCSPFVDDGQRREAAAYLESVRLLPEALEIAFLIFSSSSSSSLYALFSLHLMRDHLSSTSKSLPQHSPPSRLRIRQAMLSFLASPPPLNDDYAVNNSIANILTLCLKHDFPEQWPSAFSDLFFLASQHIRGTVVLVRVLMELELEVVVFDDKRTSAEIAHNTLIKDEMRRGSPSVVENIVSFLCSNCVALETSHSALSLACLESLVEFIGWIDLSLIVNEQVLGFLYQRLSLSLYSEVACRCLLEIVKKGMEFESKLATIQRMDLVRILQQIIPLSSSSLPQDYPLNAVAVHEQLGNLVDMLFLSLIGFWQKSEETWLKTASSNLNSFPLDALQSTVGSMMNEVFPLLLELFLRTSGEVPRAVLPSLNRFASLLKQQQRSREGIMRLGQQGHGYFVAERYMESLLMALYRQMMYAEDFSFDAEDDEEAEEMEVSNRYISFTSYYAVLATGGGVLRAQRCQTVHVNNDDNAAALHVVPFFPYYAPRYETTITSSLLSSARSFSCRMLSITDSNIRLAFNYPHIELLLYYFKICVQILSLRLPYFF